MQPPLKKRNGRILLSVKVNLPAYGQWRVYQFARQYPYMALAAAIGTLIGLAILIIILKSFI